MLLWTLLVLLTIGCKVAARDGSEFRKPPKIANIHIAAASDPAAADRRSQVGAGDLLLRTYFEDAVVEPPPGRSNRQVDVLKLNLPSGTPAKIGIFYEGGDPSARVAKVVTDPTDKENHVLQYWLKQARVPGQRKGRFKGRIQLAVSNLNLTQTYQRFRMYLHPDLVHYRSYPGVNTWFTINELWFGAQWKGHPHPFRITLTIGKEKGVGQPLRFLATGEATAGRRAPWKAVWHSFDPNFEVPIGEWMDIEMGYRQGDRNTGRFYLGVKRRSDTRITTVIDVHDWTYNPKSPRPVPMTHWNPLKLYTSSAIIDHIRNSGGVTQIFFDDLEIRKSWPR